MKAKGGGRGSKQSTVRQPIASLVFYSIQVRKPRDFMWLCMPCFRDMISVEDKRGETERQIERREREREDRTDFSKFSFLSL